MLVTNAAAEIAARENVEGGDRAVLLFSALSHDFAKADTTALRERNGRMRLTAFGHEAAGGPLARALLTRVGIKSAVTVNLAKPEIGIPVVKVVVPGLEIGMGANCVPGERLQARRAA
jgi:ribosomal protein S12 methylthiotransferase accessory factor YcaO